MGCISNIRTHGECSNGWRAHFSAGMRRESDLSVGCTEHHHSKGLIHQHMNDNKVWHLTESPVQNDPGKNGKRVEESIILNSISS